MKPRSKFERPFRKMRAMKRKITLIAALIGTLATGYAIGQNTAPNDDLKDFDRDVMTAEGSLTLGDYDSARSGAQSISNLNQKALNSEARTRAIVERTLTSYYMRTDPKAEVRLQALQVMQNARIIALLERQKNEAKP
jgi:hypothetical protein